VRTAVFELDACAGHEPFTVLETSTSPGTANS
jgi:hypothetical protein